MSSVSDVKPGCRARQRAEGRAAADTSSCLEARSGQRLRTQALGAVQKENQHVSSERRQQLNGL